MEYKFIETEEKFDFIKLLLTIIICALVLIFFSSISGIIYVSKTGETDFGISELSAYFGKTTFFLLQLIPFSLTLIALLICVKFIYKKSVRSIITSRSKFDWKRFFFSFSVWFVIMTAFLFFSLASSSSEIKWNFTPSFFYLLAVSLVFVPIQTAFEEILFRGFLMKELFKTSNSKFISLAFSSILFGLMHLNNPEVEILGNLILIYFIWTGLFLALMTFLDGGLELSIGFHTANNLFASIILTNNWQVFQTEALLKDFSAPGIDIEIWINLLIIFPFLIFIYAKIYKWDFSTIFSKSK